MARLIQFVGVQRFHHPPGIHHQHPVAEVPHHVQVVTDEDQPQIALADQFFQHVEHLTPHRHIQCRRRLVGDDHLRVGDDHHCDHDPLAHATGHLVGVQLVNPRRFANVHLGEHVQRAFSGFSFRDLVMRQISLGNLFAYLDHRVQRVFRVLHDHRHAPAANALHLFFAAVEQVDIAKTQGFCGDLRRCRVQTQQAAANGGLARAGLADNRQFLAAQRERHIADGRCDLARMTELDP